MLSACQAEEGSGVRSRTASSAGLTDEGLPRMVSIKPCGGASLERRSAAGRESWQVEVS